MEQNATFDSASGSVGRVIAARVFPKQDVIEAIENICRKYNISYGEISTTIGSFRRISLNIVTRTTPIPGTGHMTHIEREGPYSLLCGQGLISPGDEPGKLNIHFHVAVRGDVDPIIGGHVEKGTITLSTMDLFIQEVNGLKIIRKMDENLGVMMTAFEEATV